MRMCARLLLALFIGFAPFCVFADVSSLPTVGYIVITFPESLTVVNKSASGNATETYDTVGDGDFLLAGMRKVVYALVDSDGGLATHEVSVTLQSGTKQCVFMIKGPPSKMLAYPLHGALCDSLTMMQDKKGNTTTVTVNTGVSGTGDEGQSNI